jgi:hypothetical protein
MLLFFKTSEGKLICDLLQIYDIYGYSTAEVINEHSNLN